MTDDNYGIQVSGGTFNAHAVAAGPNARAEASGTSTSSLDADTAAAVRALVEELTARLQGGGDAAAALAVVEEAAAELAEEAPSRSRLVTLFTRAAEAVAPLGALAGSVDKILQLLGAR